MMMTVIVVIIIIRSRSSSTSSSSKSCSKISIVLIINVLWIVKFIKQLFSLMAVLSSSLLQYQVAPLGLMMPDALLSTGLTDAAFQFVYWNSGSRWHHRQWAWPLFVSGLRWTLCVRHKDQQCRLALAWLSPLPFVCFYIPHSSSPSWCVFKSRWWPLPSFNCTCLDSLASYLSGSLQPFLRPWKQLYWCLLTEWLCVIVWLCDCVWLWVRVCVSVWSCDCVWVCVCVTLCDCALVVVDWQFVLLIGSCYCCSAL